MGHDTLQAALLREVLGKETTGSACTVAMITPSGGKHCLAAPAGAFRTTNQPPAGSWKQI
jgi:hypothetical protein